MAGLTKDGSPKEAPDIECGENNIIFNPPVPIAAAPPHVRKGTIPTGTGGENMKLGKLLDNMAMGGRLVEKNGHCVISHKHIDKQHWRYLKYKTPDQDIFNTLIDASWTIGLLIFSCAYVVSWLLFGLLYFIIALYRGDLDDHSDDENYVPCVTNIISFTSAFLYSVETQTTVGYGAKSTTEKCPETIMIMGIQSILGIMLHTFITGFVFAKMARPEARAETIIFSDKAVISLRDGKLCLLFRIGDMRKSHLISTMIRLLMIKKRGTMEGQILPFHLFDMAVSERVILVWPVTIVHVIDAESPLYDYSAKDLAKARLEIVALLEGVVETRGMTLQTRTSYLAKEIFWGHRFDQLVSFQRDDGHYEIDFDRFHSIHAVQTPTCSARQLDEMNAQASYNLPKVVEASVDNSVTESTYPESTLSDDAEEDTPGGDSEKSPLVANGDLAETGAIEDLSAYRPSRASFANRSIASRRKSIMRQAQLENDAAATRERAANENCCGKCKQDILDKFVKVRKEPDIF